MNYNMEIIELNKAMKQGIKWKKKGIVVEFTYFKIIFEDLYFL